MTAVGRHTSPLGAVGLTCWASLSLVALALLVYAVPVLTESLQWDRGAAAAGQTWRLLTWHWCHWTGEHLFWDVMTFAVFGALCEASDRRRFVLCLLVSTVAVSVAVRLWHPELQTCRGLSGVDSALFVCAAAMFYRESRSVGETAKALAALALLALFLGKVAVECWTGEAVFADMGAVRPLPVAHLAGAAAGLAAAWGRVAVAPIQRSQATTLSWSSPESSGFCSAKSRTPQFPRSRTSPQATMQPVRSVDPATSTHPESA